jgi:hypothetical protein
VAVGLHIAGMLSAILLVAGCARVFGGRTTLGRLLLGLFGSLLFGFLFVALTTFLSREGHPDRLQGIVWLGTWVLLAYVRPPRRALLLSVGLFAYAWILSIQYVSLALSSRYTDAPEWRLRGLRLREAAAAVAGDEQPARHGTPMRITIRPAAHTWLTGLYGVDPPAGGMDQRWTAWPTAHPTGSELYYLAWVEHGSFGQRGAAAQALLRLSRKQEYALIEKVYQRQEGVVRDMLLLSLFELKPEAHRGAVTRLMNREYDSADAEGWVKTDDVFEGQGVDFYFDGPGEAALSLLAHGDLSDRAVEILMQYARSFYSEQRERVRGIFDLFPGLPPYDAAPQQATINDSPPLTEKQTKAVERWLRDNLRRLRWSASERRYQLR